MRVLSYATQLVLLSVLCSTTLLRSDVLHAAAREEARDGIALGPATLLPAVHSELRYDDNIFESADVQRDSLIAMLIPSLESRVKLGNSVYELGYRAESAVYFDSEDDDYVDHNFSALANMQFSRRNNLTLSANFAAAHEDRGTGLTEGFNPTLAQQLNEPDEFDQTDAGVRYTYGSHGAPASLTLDIAYRELEYQNHRQRTAFRDREESSAGAKFSYRIRSTTALLLQARTTSIDYLNDQPQQATLDSDLYRYLIGAEWDNSVHLRGAVKFGYQQKQFAAAERDNFSAPSWELDLTWSPRSYTHLNFYSERSSQETNGGGDFIDVQRIGTEWTHDWNSQLRSIAGFAYVDEEFQNFDRNEQLSEFSASFAYQLKRWLALHIGGIYRDRSSNLDLLNFNRSVISVGIDVTI